MTPANSRRKFLKQSSTLGAGALLLPDSLNLPDNTRKDLVGHGDFRYSADANWGALDPTQNPLQHCHEMELDGRGRLVCSSVARKHNVLVYNKDGKLLDTWHHQLTEPHGLSKAGEGSDQTFWLTDSADGRVINLDLDGRLIRKLSIPKDHLREGETYKPTETAVTANGDIYVTDGYGTNKIFHFDDKGQLRNVFGGKDHFNCSHGITVDTRTGEETLLITSRGANEFQRWSLAGKHLKTYRLPGLSICRPVIQGDYTYFAVIVTKSWWSYDGMVAVLDKDFNVISLPGGSAPDDQEDFSKIVHDNRTFMSPHDVCLDEDGNLYVPQWFSGRTYPIRLKRV